MDIRFAMCLLTCTSFLPLFLFSIFFLFTIIGPSGYSPCPFLFIYYFFVSAISLRFLIGLTYPSHLISPYPLLNWPASMYIGHAVLGMNSRVRKLASYLFVAIGYLK